MGLHLVMNFGTFVTPDDLMTLDDFGTEGLEQHFSSTEMMPEMLYTPQFIHRYAQEYRNRPLHCPLGNLKNFSFTVCKSQKSFLMLQQHEMFMRTQRQQRRNVKNIHEIFITCSIIIFFECLSLTDSAFTSTLPCDVFCVS